MSLVAQIYESAANTGLLKECVWYPSNGAPSQRHQVGFAAPDESLLDGLTLSTDYEMTYPGTAFGDLLHARWSRSVDRPSRCETSEPWATVPNSAPS